MSPLVSTTLPSAKPGEADRLNFYLYNTPDILSSVRHHAHQHGIKQGDCHRFSRQVSLHQITPHCSCDSSELSHNCTKDSTVQQGLTCFPSTNFICRLILFDSVCILFYKWPSHTATIISSPLLMQSTLHTVKKTRGRFFKRVKHAIFIACQQPQSSKLFQGWEPSQVRRLVISHLLLFFCQKS